MRILNISDTHNKHRKLQEEFPFPLDCNTIVHNGDITMTGTLQEVKEFLEWFSGLYQFENKIFIGGNHDWVLQEAPELVRALIPDNVIYLEDNGVEIDGVTFWGSPYTPAFKYWAFMRERGEDIAKHWKKIPEGIDVLITHGAPYGILDYVPYVAYSNRDENPHVGCQDLFIELDRIRPKYHLFGHIHPSYGIWKTETCTFINASVVTGKHYTVTNPPFIIEV